MTGFKKVAVLLAIVAVSFFSSKVTQAADTSAPALQFEAAQTITLPGLKPDSYPSLVAYDLDKDGTLELITSGVRGQLVFSKRSAPGELKWIDSKPLLGVDKNQIDFDNW